jgi:hypothetical protein
VTLLLALQLLRYTPTASRGSLSQQLVLSNPCLQHITAVQTVTVEERLLLLLQLLLQLRRRLAELLLLCHSATALRNGSLSQLLAASLGLPHLIPAAVTLQPCQQQQLPRCSMVDTSVAHTLLLLQLVVTVVLVARHLYLERSLLLLLLVLVLILALLLLVLLLVLLLLACLLGQLRLKMLLRETLL